MIAKLEGTHSWNGGAVVLNDLDVWPRFELSKINGLGSIGDTDDQRSNRQGRRGENPRPAVRRGKTVSYEGTIHARSLYELRQAEEDLGAAFDPLVYGGLLEGQMVSAPHPEAVRKNLVTNPSFEVDTAGWQGTSAALSPGGAVARSTMSSFRGVASGRVTTTAATSAQGVAIPLGTLPFGRTYQVRLMIRMTNLAGTTLRLMAASQVDPFPQLIIANSIADQKPGGYFKVAGSFVSNDTNPWHLIIRTNGAAAVDFYIDEVQVVEAASAPDYFDGDAAGARWEGVPHASISRLPSTDRTYRARPLSCIVPEEQASNEWKRPFAVTLRLSDPRVFFPDEIPLAQSPGTAGDSAVAISNPGRADADPVLEVIGPTNAAWSVENTTLVRSLRFTGFALTAGQTAIIDFSDRTIKLAGVDQSSKLDLAQSDWWDRETAGLAGKTANTITLKPGVGASTATRVGVRYRPADPA